MISIVQAKAAPVKVADLLQTTRIAGATLSPDGRRIAYVGDGSGRLNLWLMNIDGTEARQLLHDNDRQADLAFTHNGREIVYIQDKGGDEMYDIFALPLDGGEPRNLTKTDQTSEMGLIFTRWFDACLWRQRQDLTFRQYRGDALAFRAGQVVDSRD